MQDIMLSNKKNAEAGLLRYTQSYRISHGHREHHLRSLELYSLFLLETSCTHWAKTNCALFGFSKLMPPFTDLGHL